MAKLIPLTIFIIAKNEADRIAATLNPAMKLAEDVLVVDSGSTDGTQGLCESIGARVLYNEWAGYGLQKRFAEDNSKFSWLLNLDADEVMPVGLVEELRDLFKDGAPDVKAWEIPIAEVFPGESQPHRYAYSLAPVRLYSKEVGRYSESPVHDRVVLEPNTNVHRLKNRIHHFSTRSLAHEMQKFNNYSDMQVSDLAKRGKTLPGWRLFTEFPFAFFKAYFLRRHFLRGQYGYMVAMNYAMFRHLRVAKHLERRLMANSEASSENDTLS